MESIERFRAALGIERCVPVLHDWGGLIGLAWAASTPKPWSLVISSSGFFSDGSGTAWRRRCAPPGPARSSWRASTATGSAGCSAPSPRDRRGRRWTSTGRRLADDAAPLPTRVLPLDGLREAGPVRGGGSPSLGVPVLLVWGGGTHSPRWPPRIVSSVSFPDTRLALFEDAGHFVWEDEPERSAAAVVELLGGHLSCGAALRPGGGDRRSSGLPLAARMRPRSLGEFVGQEHLLGRGSGAAHGHRGRPPALDDPLRAARHREDHARAHARRELAGGLRGGVRGAGGRPRCAR